MRKVKYIILTGVILFLFLSYPFWYFEYVRPVFEADESQANPTNPLFVYLDSLTEFEIYCSERIKEFAPHPLWDSLADRTSQAHLWLFYFAEPEHLTAADIDSIIHEIRSLMDTSFLKIETPP